ncbi:indolepyruvate ferredoxin oxidoreductase family protein [soil metagenome]
MTMTPPREIALTDRYERYDGDVLVTGIQALVRLPMEQRIADREAGLSTATLVSGYEGSPLAGFDLELARQKSLLDEHDIVFKPAVNEELAANAVQGSQLASTMESRKYDGVVGIWYGKAPGLDRATDAFRHANLGGSSEHGGVLALVGDDSIAKSSSVPSSSEVAIAELGMPILVPSDPQEMLDLGLHGIALSRFSGLWVAMKLATNVVDGSATTTMKAGRISSVLPSREFDGVPFHHEVSAHFLQPKLGELEASLVGQRLELARRYAVANSLARTTGDVNAEVGIISAGATHRDTMQALKRLGVDSTTLDNSGVRVLKLGMIYPLDPETIRRFASGLSEIIVIEEKKAFIELGVKDALFDVADRPRVFGKRGPSGAALMRAGADLPPEFIAEQLAARFADHSRVTAQKPVSRIIATGRPYAGRMLPLLPRTPYFCSGCPHNRSTVVPDGSLVGAGIGCHTIVAMMPEQRVGDVIGLCQMGGEGGTWIGMAPFVGVKHLVQNLGDGTFHHSGILAIRASVAARSNITYKLLYNDAVAMTGGQAPVGRMSVPSLVRELLAEGVAKVIVTTDDVKKYRGVRMPREVKVIDRDRLIEIQNDLASIPGVTVLVHDQECATELRRKRKRKLVAEPTQRAFINERVCEGCGDCGQKSNCMSVQPVETDFGRKTRIDQASCNKDYSCLDGNCPSFVTVTPSTKPAKKTEIVTAAVAAAQLPDPVAHARLDDFGMRIMGVGGTGVVTTAQIIATAASLAGVYVRGLDQLGLAQKGGAVVSDIKMSRDPIAGANKLAPGECDLYLGCDVLVASAEANLAVASPDRTIAIVSTSKVPTGAMILAPDLEFPSTEDTRARIASVTRDEFSAFADIRSISNDRFGSDQYANIILVGMAVQAGALPLEASAIEKAIELNGVAVSTNLRAFATGRQIVLDPETFALVRSRRAHVRSPLQRSTEIVSRLNASAPDELREIVSRLTPELIAYQGPKYAEKYVDSVERIRALEESALGASGVISKRFASSLFKLMAYKDEFEVARLYIEPEFEQTLRAEFGEGARFSYKLHPPMLKAMGVSRKITLGPWFKPVFRLLYAMRLVRGTWLDPFGYAGVRRTERRLIGEFTHSVEESMGEVTPATRDIVERIAGLPEEIRGYEEVKTRNVELFRARLAESRALLAGGGASPVVR